MTAVMPQVLVHMELLGQIRHSLKRQGIKMQSVQELGHVIERMEFVNVMKDLLV